MNSAVLRVFFLAGLFSLSAGDYLFSQNRYSGEENIYQELYRSVQNTYGFNQELVNGIFYVNRYLHALGHPFFGDDRFETGDLIFRDKTYQNVKMKYDIFEQKLLVNCNSGDKQINVLLPDEFLSRFSFNNMFFRFYTLKGIEPGYYQVINDDGLLKCLYHWVKTRSTSDYYRIYLSYEFSDNIKKSYLISDDKVVQYRGNREFINFFEKDLHSQIRKYIRQNKINVRTCVDSDMIKLIKYCKLLTEGRESG